MKNTPKSLENDVKNLIAEKLPEYIKFADFLEWMGKSPDNPIVEYTFQNALDFVAVYLENSIDPEIAKLFGVNLAELNSVIF